MAMGDGDDQQGDSHLENETKAVGDCDDQKGDNHLEKGQRRWERCGSAGRHSPSERYKGDGDDKDQQDDSHLGRWTKAIWSTRISKATVT